MSDRSKTLAGSMHAACSSRAALLRLLIAVCAVLPLGLVAGCGGDDALAPVEGVVRLDGQPLTKGVVRFTPEAGRSARGTIRSDGTFQLGTFSESDGALVGMHQVSIIATEGYRAEDVDDSPGRPAVTPTVPVRYASPDSSDLTFEVKPSTRNRAEIDLATQ